MSDKDGNIVTKTVDGFFSAISTGNKFVDMIVRVLVIGAIVLALVVSSATSIKQDVTTVATAAGEYVTVVADTGEKLIGGDDEEDNADEPVDEGGDQPSETPVDGEDGEVPPTPE